MDVGVAGTSSRKEFVACCCLPFFPNSPNNGIVGADKTKEYKGSSRIRGKEKRAEGKPESVSCLVGIAVNLHLGKFMG